MKKFTKFTSTCFPIRTENIDTDQIIPARFLKTIKRFGLGKYLFYNLRFHSSGKPKKDNIFEDKNYKNAKILVVGDNFGCGSSREHAVWAIQDFGFRAVVSSSFGDIFYINAFKNGLLPVILNSKQLNKLFTLVEENSKTKVIIDLERQKLLIPFVSLSYHFEIDQFRKTQLIKGVDDLGYILSFENKINEYEKTNSSPTR